MDWAYIAGVIAVAVLVGRWAVRWLDRAVCWLDDKVVSLVPGGGSHQRWECGWSRVLNGKPWP